MFKAVEVRRGVQSNSRWRVSAEIPFCSRATDNTAMWSVDSSPGTDWIMRTLPTAMTRKPFPSPRRVRAARSKSSLGSDQRREKDSHANSLCTRTAYLFQESAQFFDFNQSAVAITSAETHFDDLYCQLIIKVPHSQQLCPKTFVCCKLEIHLHLLQAKGSTPIFVHISAKCLRNSGFLLISFLYFFANSSKLDLNVSKWTFILNHKSFH